MTLNKTNRRNNTWLQRTLRLLPVLGVFAGVAAGMQSAPAQALPSTMVEYEYYSDDTFSELVGWRLANSCYGVENYVDGEITPYRIRYEESCNHPTPPVMSYWYCPDPTCELIDGKLTCVYYDCVLLP